ncbi:DUF4230 domain-containing protein [Streptomyces sp. TLI_105]|uniref:DUF4230 domain-containing protein n=1 Tax=Streptomyces sp. TLI_105 TaxID=1881019 RepID=UPI00089C7ACD|nr:DUF4230 domain-containing protein [Streptomyces sp. TLI_105]SEE18585.1 Protein of unknown function [Streptomyces sp. TLI_105]
MGEDTENRPSPPCRTKRRSGGKWRLVIVALLVLAVALMLIGQFLRIPGLDVFGTQVKDRSGPAVLKAVQDLSRYEGAAGTYQVVVDLEHDARFLPDSIRGTRTLYVASGSVGAYVELGRLGDGTVTVDADRTEATLRLPHARLAAPALDPERSYAVSKQRGLLDRLGDLFSDNPASEQAVNVLAAQRISDAARESGLTSRAERNTTEMLRKLLLGLGFERVTVTYA